MPKPGTKVGAAEPAQAPRLWLQELRLMAALAGGRAMAKAAAAEAAGFSPISGSVTRAIHGIKMGSSSGAPCPGLAGMGLAELVEVDVDGVKELLVRLTPAGEAAWQAWTAAGGRLPDQKDKGSCVNERYGRRLRDGGKGL